jgi:hypothetical protein
LPLRTREDVVFLDTLLAAKNTDVTTLVQDFCLGVVHDVKATSQKEAEKASLPLCLVANALFGRFDLVMWAVISYTESKKFMKVPPNADVILASDFKLSLPQHTPNVHQLYAKLMGIICPTMK